MNFRRTCPATVTELTVAAGTQMGETGVFTTMRVREKGDRGVVQSVVMFLGVSVLSGALAAGLAIPFAGLAGVTTGKTSDTLQDLPQQFDEGPLQQKSTILAADGTVIATLAEQNRVPVKLKDVAPIMQKAIVAIEDDRFYEHGALDAKGTLRALLQNQSAGTVQQGGSSIHPAVRED